MRAFFRSPWMALGATLTCLAFLVPIIELATSTAASGATYPDISGEPVGFGDAGSIGSIAGTPVVGMASTPDGGGYWLVGPDGGVFSFGDAAFHGSMGGKTLNAPVVGMAATPDGGGYWLVGSDGGIYSFGDAGFYNSLGETPLYAPIVGMAATPDGKGYWLVGSDGGIFAFGDAAYFGSMAAQQPPNPITAIVPTPDGGGYWLLPTTEISSATLTPGSSGPAVVALQKRLSALGYWVGTTDGTFGDSTEQAVYALQKAAGISRSGVVSLSTEEALARGVLPQPRSTSGYVIEIDLEDDLLMVVTNGKIDYVFNTSTGGGYTYTDDGVTSVADTPVGQFQIYRQVDGLVVDSLGALWRPKFFEGGFAIHGDSYVPPEPVSHGCARVSNEAIDWIWSNNVAPIGTAVWVY